MGKEEIFEKLKEIIVDRLGVDDESISMDSKFEKDFGADSLDAVDIEMEVEKKFGISIPIDNGLTKDMTVEEAIDAIEKNM